MSRGVIVYGADPTPVLRVVGDAIERAFSGSMEVVEESQWSTLLSGNTVWDYVVFLGEGAGSQASADTQIPYLRIHLASKIRDLVSVTSRDSDKQAAGMKRATALGLSALAWDGDDGWEAWENLGAPLLATPIAGSPDYEKRWLLVDGGFHECGPAEPGHQGRETVLDEVTWQVHYLGEKKDAKRGGVDCVVWKDAPLTNGQLLGKANAVVGGVDSPLAWDAWRAGIDVLSPSSPTAISSRNRAYVTLEPPRPHPRLVHLVPQEQTGHWEFWKNMVSTWNGAEDPVQAIAGYTLYGQVEAGAEPGYPEDSDDPRPEPTFFNLLKRRLKKMKRDPKAFCEDSKYRLLRGLSRFVG